jgi:hypothetical protein
MYVQKKTLEHRKNHHKLVNFRTEYPSSEDDGTKNANSDDVKKNVYTAESRFLLSLLKNIHPL